MSTATVIHKRRFDWTKFGLTLWGVAMFVFLFLPIIWIVAYSFNTGRLLTVWNGFGLESYHLALHQSNVPRGCQGLVDRGGAVRVAGHRPGLVRRGGIGPTPGEVDGGVPLPRGTCARNT